MPFEIIGPRQITDLAWGKRNPNEATFTSFGGFLFYFAVTRLRSTAGRWGVTIVLGLLILLVGPSRIYLVTTGSAT